MKSKRIAPIFMMMIFFSGLSYAQEGRTEIELSGEGWSLWLDSAADWYHDEIYLSPMNVSTLPINPPSVDWQALHNGDVDFKIVDVLGTVEEYYWGDIGGADISGGPRTGDDYVGVSDVYERLEAFGIELVEPAPPDANFVLAVQSGNLIYLSGHGPDRPDGTKITGKLGSGDLTLEEGIEAARLTGIALLASLQQKIGDLNKVSKIIKVNGMVNADLSFTKHSQVINGFSDLMVDLFGESGNHARASVGMSSLPGNIAVEIDMIVEVID